MRNLLGAGYRSLQDAHVMSPTSMSCRLQTSGFNLPEEPGAESAWGGDPQWLANPTGVAMQPSKGKRLGFQTISSM